MIKGGIVQYASSCSVSHHLQQLEKCTTTDVLPDNMLISQQKFWKGILLPKRWQTFDLLINYPQQIPSGHLLFSSQDNPLGKFNRNLMIINSVPCWQTYSKIVLVFQSAVVKGLKHSLFAIFFKGSYNKVLFFTLIYRSIRTITDITTSTGAYGIIKEESFL